MRTRWDLGGEDNVLFWDAAQQWSWDADGEGQIRKQENASISLLLFLIPIGHHAVSFFKFQNESILPKIFFVKLWCNVLPPNCQPLPIRSWTSFPSPAGLKWHQTPEHRCNADTKGGPWVEMLPDTSARLFLLPPQDMGMLGKGGRSRIPAVNFPFSTIPGNSLQYCIVRNLNEVGYWRGWQSGGLGYFSLWCHTVTLVTALLKYSEYFEVDVAEHSTRACIDTRMGQNPLNGPKFQGCWPSFSSLPASPTLPVLFIYNMGS